MNTLHIDLETYSSAHLGSCGVYAYTEAEDFEILLFGYSADGGPVRVVDLAAGEELPEEITAALTDDGVIKLSHNVQFERICLSRLLRDRGLLPEGSRYLNPASWRCSMIWAATLSLPLSLDAVGEVLGLEKKKLSEGKDLIRFFCSPCSPTAANGFRKRNRAADAPEKWAAFRRYNARDVETELSICEKLARFPVPDSVWEEFVLDQEINDRGVALDRMLVRQAIIMDARSQAELTERLKVLTGLENPNSVVQMKRWLSDHGLTLPSLGKSEVQASMMTAPPELQEVLMLRQQLARSSVKKYQAMESAVCADGRARGMFQFFGSRTGRWTGRLIQLQNLPQNRMQDLEQARDLVRQGAYETLKMLYGDVPDILSQLVRTAFVPQEGRKLIVADFSSVEARILAWYAGEGWRQEVFRRGEDLYCASASQMFRCRVEKHGQNAELRQKGKISELALGFGGSVGALRAMGAVELGLREDELQPLVDRWRSSNPAIVRFWRDVDQAAIQAVRMHSESSVAGVRFRYRSGMLLITLPSGRSLCYIRPAIGINRFGGECITYEGLGSTRKWERLETFGAKLVENIVQATARDLLCHAMQTLRGCRIVMHIHDELVIEADRNLTVQDVCDNMSQTPSWAEGLLLAADGFETEFYRKG